jgi:signal transduction histidine kinase
MDEEGNDLVLYAQRGLHHSHVGMLIPLEEGMCSHVIRTGEALVTGPVSEDPRLAVPEFGQEQIQAMILVPMHSRGEVVGVLSAMSHVPQEFSEQDVDLLKAIANPVGAAAENARLYQAVKEHAVSLEEAYARLQELDKLKDEMIQNISHEVRTPLTFVKGYVGMVLEGGLGPLTDLQRSSLDVVARKAEQLNHLISGIITLQTLSPETLSVEPIDLAETVETFVKDWHPTISDAGIVMQNKIPEGFPLALADEHCVEQVFDNLLSNAVKFSPEGGIIEVSAREEGDWLRVEVTDKGIGIPPSQISRIFDRFYQVDGSAQRRFGGAGLGLSIVKLIIEAHGGEVKVQSSLEEGSTFSFTLPKAPSRVGQVGSEAG